MIFVIIAPDLQNIAYKKITSNGLFFQTILIDHKKCHIMVGCPILRHLTDVFPLL